jgi:nitric oxide reductase NorQ protein
MKSSNPTSPDVVPFYLPIGDEIDIFRAAHSQHLPVLLKGPTGCGKTRFVEHMTAQLIARSEQRPHPLITVACNEDLTASDLVGRYLIRGDETVWMDGPLTQAVRQGAVCYLDEIVEARKDTMVLIHPLTDHRRILPIDKLGQILDAHSEFMLVVSYNPGYQSVLKDLKPSTRQRFVTLEFDYPPRDKEAEIIAHESGIDLTLAMDLAHLGERVRELKSSGLEEGVSARLLIYAAQLIGRGLSPRDACHSTVVLGLSDDRDTQAAIAHVVKAIFA